MDAGHCYSVGPWLVTGPGRTGIGAWDLERRTLNHSPGSWPEIYNAGSLPGVGKKWRNPEGGGWEGGSMKRRLAEKSQVGSQGDPR